MYLRFQGLRQNDRSSSRLGIFQLAFEVLDEGLLPKHAECELLENLGWLRKHLKSPDILDADGHHRAISWFNPRAKEPLRRIRAIKAILEEVGYHIQQVETRDPGVVIYEDGWQVVAKPRKSAS
ncbi:MAG: hypothetical protein AAF438_20275 [Pseudomonadota bacterium]